MQSINIHRPLGAVEQIYWLHDRAHPVHFALAAQIKGQFTVRQLQQALTLVQQRHPLLRVAQRQSEQHWQ